MDRQILPALCPSQQPVNILHPYKHPDHFYRLQTVLSEEKELEGVREASEISMWIPVQWMLQIFSSRKDAHLKAFAPMAH